MFTGIIQEVGRVAKMRTVGGGVHITVEAPGALKELKVNDSISIGGVCQTVIDRGETTFTVEAVEETLRKTTLGELKASSRVNIELPMKLDDRIGGHLVQGHVDGVGIVKSVKEIESSWLITIVIPKEFMRYIIPVGSIAVDGVSLTVASMEENEVVVSIIPHTMERTTFGELRKGSRVNLECDLIGKYIERLLLGEKGKVRTSAISQEKLSAWGYGA
jgi:riboflavin synthase